MEELQKEMRLMAAQLAHLQAQQDVLLREKVKKKVFHFEYNVGTQTLRELEDWEAPDNHPSWASVSPDSQTIIFARRHNLYMMNGVDYQQILDARRGKDGDEADEDDEEIEENMADLAWGPASLKLDPVERAPYYDEEDAHHLFCSCGSGFSLSSSTHNQSKCIFYISNIK